MYAVIRAGGKQHKVAKGDIIEVEKVADGGGDLEYTPLLIVDDKGKVRSGRSELSKALVTAKVVEQTKGPKIEVYKFRNKSRYRRHAGHRQKYSKIEISGIKLSGGKSASAKSEGEAEDGT